MKKKRNIFYTLSLVTLAFLFVSCNQSQGKKAAQPRIQSYPVVDLQTKTVKAYTTYATSIEGIINSEVRAKVSGYITDVLVDEGQQVKKGQVLFKLETQSLTQEAKAAKANVNAAQVEVNKLKPLVNKNIISPVQLETAKAKLAQAKSNLNSIQANIGYANIKSPVNGYVGSIRLREGALVSPGNQQPLTVVSDISKVYAYFSMNEAEYLNFIQDQKGKSMQEKIKAFPKVELTLANGSLFHKKGTIETVNSQVNKQTGTIAFRAVFDNPERILTNGNSGQIRVPTTYTDALVVPKTATYEQQGKIMLAKLGQDDKVTFTNIQVKATLDNVYVIESGIKKGATILAEGATKVSPGAKIKPQPVSFDSVTQPIKKVFR